MKQIRLPTEVIASGLTSRLRLAALLGLLAGLALLLQAAPVLAHANLARAEPAPNSVLDAPPGQVIIWFTEPLAPEFSAIEVLDSQGHRVDNGDSAVDPNDPTVMSVTLPPLPNGTYTVAWRNLSTVDGHGLRGSYAFSVGEPLAEGAAPADGEGPLFQSPADPVFRWLTLLSALVVVGGLAFDLLVLRPVLLPRGTGAQLRHAGSRAVSHSRAFIWLGLAVFLAASLGHLAAQAGSASGLSPLAVVGRPLVSIMTSTDWGQAWMLRFGLFAAMGLVLRAADALESRAERKGRESFRTYALWSRVLATALGLDALLTFSLASHAAATPGIQAAAIFNDYIHLLAAALWVGGLFHLAVSIPVLLRLPSARRREALSGLVPRFSTLAALSVGVLVITGLYNAWAQVTVLPALQVPYGLTLLAKVALVAVLLLLAAANLLWVRPRLRRDDRAALWLRRLVWGEAALAALVILLTGLLTSMEPARQVASLRGIGLDEGIAFQDTAEGTRIELGIEPGLVGPNRVVVALSDHLGRPITSATDVRVRLSYLGADLGEEALSATHAGGGGYVLEDALISIAGPWQVEVTVQRPDAFDARTAFRFEAASAGASGGGAIAPSRETGLLLFGIELAALGLLFFIVGIPLGGLYSRRGLAVMAPGIVAALAGVVLIANTQFGDVQSGEPVVNPFAPDQESLAIGQQVYAEHCLTCHGAEGMGDGPQGVHLHPPPADLRVHVPLHSDRQLFRFIRDGIQGTAMPAFRDQLSDEEIWHVINYLKTFE